MESLDVKTYLVAALVTLFLFLSILTLNSFMSQQREQKVTEKMNEIIDDFQEVETAYYLLDYMQQQNTSCPILLDQLNALEEKMWLLGSRLQGYQEVTQNFESDEFYVREKKKLNRREVIHLTLLEKVKDSCDLNHTIVLYFYGDCENNLKCDEQGFVLTYINQQIDPQISVFSFDTDRNIASVSALERLYNVTEYPCIVVDGNTYCGLQNRNKVKEILCSHSPYLEICPENA